MAWLSYHLVHNVQVDVSEEEDQFQAVTTACLTVLILAVETRLDTALQQMTRVPWATLETVSFSLRELPWCCLMLVVDHAHKCRGFCPHLVSFCPHLVSFCPHLVEFATDQMPAQACSCYVSS